MAGQITGLAGSNRKILSAAPEAVAQKQRHGKQKHGDGLVCRAEKYRDSHDQCRDAERNLEYGGMQ